MSLLIFCFTLLLQPLSSLLFKSFRVDEVGVAFANVCKIDMVHCLEGVADPVDDLDFFYSMPTIVMSYVSVRMIIAPKH